MSFSAFLQGARGALAHLQPTSHLASPVSPARLPKHWESIASTAKVRLVVGNESADIDSVCSAFLFAYLQTHATRQWHVPIVNVMRDDLPLRPELDLIFRPMGISPQQDLITLTDITAAAAPTTADGRTTPEIHPARPRLLVTPDNADVFLVDHNVPTSAFQAFRQSPSALLGCVDHHVDEHIVPDPPRAGLPRTIEVCGSCVSLVLAHFQQRPPLAAAAADDQPWATASPLFASAHERRAFGHVALGALSTDTSGFRQEAVIRPTDRAMLAYLQTDFLTARDDSEHDDDFIIRDPEVYHARASEYMRDYSRMTLRDIWRKDYKEFALETAHGTVTLGTGVSLQAFHTLLDKTNDDDDLAAGDSRDGRADIDALERLVQSTADFARERSLDLFSLNTMWPSSSTTASPTTPSEGPAFGPDSIIHKEVILIAFTPAAAQLVRAFDDLAAEELALVDLPTLSPAQLRHLTTARADSTIPSTDHRRRPSVWAWAMLETKFTRKKLVPLFKEAAKLVRT